MKVIKLRACGVTCGCLLDLLLEYEIHTIIRVSLLVFFRRLTMIVLHLNGYEVPQAVEYHQS
jgi:hypothetical protein